MVLRLSDSNMWLSVLGLRWIVDGTWTMREMCGTRAMTEYRAWYIGYDSGLLPVLRLRWMEQMSYLVGTLATGG